MCGITGIIAFNEKGQVHLSKINTALQTLTRRGPDANNTFHHQHIALGHARLSIIDTSEASAQPFVDKSGRYVMVFNGEIYNFKSIRKELVREGYSFETSGDTEVLLTAYIHWGVKALDKLNGFFALVIYDKQTQNVFIARDRIGIKPLLIYQDEDKLIFASEMKALLAYNIPKEIDQQSLYTYLQINYIPSPYSIFKNIRKLAQGHYFFINKNKEKTANNFGFELTNPQQFYSIPYTTQPIKSKWTYEEAQKQLIVLMEEAVKKRLIADVPLGCFLSGGIDSSVITALASRHTKKLNTFSIGYKDEPFFDETKYAQLVAKRYQTNHTVFSLTNNDLYQHLQEVLDYIDEPFADASALPVYILSKETRKYATVALSGDGGDELFAGYNKHLAEWRARNIGFLAPLLKMSAPIWKALPQSRSSKMGNKIRQINRFVQGVNLSNKERYWQWASILDGKNAEKLLVKDVEKQIFESRKNKLLKAVVNNGAGSLNDVLYADMNMVLVGDMLTKADQMSMANGLEIRTPFLDHELVDFAFGLPVEYKINSHLKKRILQDAFRPSLPQALYNRPKQGFDVPLLKWFNKELKAKIVNKWFDKSFIEAQGIFHFSAVQQLLQKLFSNNPGDTANTVWALIVFQNWWKNTY